MNKKKVRCMVLVLGDQLNRDSAAFDGFDPNMDRVWMAEVEEESTHVWSHRARIVMFLAAMRHYRDRLRADGMTVIYHALAEQGTESGLAGRLGQDLDQLQPDQVRMVLAGDFRVQRAIETRCHRAGVPLQVVSDRHFLCAPDEFAIWAEGRRQLRMEYFYREQRRRHDILMADGKPLGGRWNFDADNRRAFDRHGPGALIQPVSFPPDTCTTDVIRLVERRFGSHPGATTDFDWPVTSTQARAALDDFVAYRLPSFGTYQDAMWEGEPWLYHSQLSAALNLKLLSPAEVIDAAVDALVEGRVPLASVEGFVRQILGWREFVRGIYWQRMPEYASTNALEADAPLPGFYWSGETDLACLRWTLTQTLRYGYAHHIQRLMVTGLFALLFGVEPRRVHEWYLAIYVDAVEWVELPNTLGMSQFADGGVLASKPYVASGRYIDRMSNHCANCRYRPDRSTGDDACPFTTLYWEFLMRHETRFADHPRAALQWRNLARLDERTRGLVRKRAARLRAMLA